MKTEHSYIEKNKSVWNARTDVHFNSEFYDVDGFIKGKSSLNEIELKMLGDISGKSILHLQCHFGQDSLSLGRMGAAVTGVDLSDRAILKAKELAEQLNIAAKFICCDIYELDKHLDEKFDIVFTTYGTIGWLPDLDKWAKIVSQFLKSGGKFIFADFHPVIWMFDNKVEKIAYSYFNAAPIVEIEEGTYADKTAAIKLESVGWNHSISEVVNSLISNGIRIDALDEFDYSPYNVFENMAEVAPGKYQIIPMGNKLPLVYSIIATKTQDAI